MRLSKMLNWIVVGLAALQIVGPFALWYWMIIPALISAILSGAALAAAGYFAIKTNHPDIEKYLDWVGIVIGVWMVLAPAIMGFSFTHVALWVSLILGAIAAALESWASMTIRTEHELPRISK